MSTTHRGCVTMFDVHYLDVFSLHSTLCEFVDLLHHDRDTELCVYREGRFAEVELTLHRDKIILVTGSKKKYMRGFIRQLQKQGIAELPIGTCAVPEEPSTDIVVKTWYPRFDQLYNELSSTSLCD